MKGERIPRQEGIFILSVHDEKYSPEEIILSVEHFPSPKWKEGDLIQIDRIGRPDNQSDSLRFSNHSISFPFQPTNEEDEKRKKRLILRIKSIVKVKNFQLSLHSTVASLFDLTAKCEVVIQPITEEKAEVEFVEMSFKDQYLGRSDMWRLKMSLYNNNAYTGKNVQFSNIRAQIREMVGGGSVVSSGVITEKTKMIYRSKSAKFFLMIQMSREMWNFAEEGELYFEKAINRFLKELFDRWNNLGSSHSLSIILFSRTYFEADAMTDQEKEEATEDVDGRFYKDFYRVICDELKSDWDATILQLKCEFTKYAERVAWDDDSFEGNMGTNSSAEDGNFLEAINLALGVFDKHYIDRDLNRTGQLICVVTAGSGVFNVDSQLKRMTKQRMNDNGIGCDLISVRGPPLHRVPLFKFKDKINTSSALSPTLNSQNGSGTKAYYDIPHWIHMSFYDAHKYQQNKNKLYLPAPPKLEINQKPSKKRTILIPKDSSFNQPALFNYLSKANITYGNNSNSNININLNSYDESIFINEDNTLESSSYQPKPTFSFQTPRNLESREDSNLDHNSVVTDLEPSSFGGSEMKDDRIPNSLNSNAGGIRASRIGSKIMNGDSDRKRKSSRMINPFDFNEGFGINASGTINRKSSSRSRWVHLFSGTGGVRYTNTWPFPPNWRSLCEPASQPTTNDYFPDALELAKSFSEGFYTVSLYDRNLYEFKTDLFVKELISQRLAHNYQLIINSEEETNDGASNNPASNTKTPKRLVYLMSLGHNYHKITYENTSQNVEVKRYHLKQANLNAKIIPYKCFIWPIASLPLKDGPAVCSKTEFKYQSIASYPWNAIDSIISGWDEDNNFDSKINYWRCRYALMSTNSPLTAKRQPGGQSQFHQDRISSFQKCLTMLLQSGFKKQTTEKIDVTTSAPKEEAETFTKLPLLNKVLRTEIDPAKTDRPEWVILKYDSHFDSGSVYHLEFNWVVATGGIVEDFFSNLQRKAKLNGFNVIQVPSEQDSNKLYIADIPVEIKPEIDSFCNESGWSIKEIVQTKFDFVPDQSKPDYYVHRQGAIFLTYFPQSKSFLWKFNHLSGVRSILPAAISLFKDFMAFWSDKSYTIERMDASFETLMAGKVRANSNQPKVVIPPASVQPPSSKESTMEDSSPKEANGKPSNPDVVFESVSDSNEHFANRITYWLALSDLKIEE